MYVNPVGKNDNSLLLLHVGHFEQSTALTSWIDASQVYGNTPEKAALLRDQRSAAQFGRGKRVM